VNKKVFSDLVVPYQHRSIIIAESIASLDIKSRGKI